MGGEAGPALPCASPDSSQQEETLKGKGPSDTLFVCFFFYCIIKNKICDVPELELDIFGKDTLEKFMGKAGWISKGLAEKLFRLL